MTLLYFNAYYRFSDFLHYFRICIFKLPYLFLIQKYIFLRFFLRIYLQIKSAPKSASNIIADLSADLFNEISCVFFYKYFLQI